MISVVVINPSGTAIRTSLLGRPGVRLTVLNRAGAEEAAGAEVVRLDLRRSSAGARVRELAWRNVISRTMFRLSPWDGARLVWRRIRRDPAARTALARADLIVAADRDAAFSAWKTTRRRPTAVRAVLGFAAAEAMIEDLEAGSP